MLKPIVLTAAVLTITPSLARAAQVIATWKGGNGNWDDSSKWVDGAVPSNSGGTTYNVLIDGGDAASSTVTFGFFSPSTTHTVDALTIDAGDTLAAPLDTIVTHTLTALNGLTVNGTLDADSGHWRVGADQAFGGSGILRLRGTADSTAGSVTIGPALTVSGYAGTLGNNTRPTLNQGLVWANGLPPGSNPQLALTVAGNTITNGGTFKVSAGNVLAFDTHLQQLSDLGTLVNEGGAFRVAGTLDNTGRSFTVDQSTGDWQFSGIVRGGSFISANGRSLTAIGPNAILDGVQVNGDLKISGARLTLPAGQSLAGTGAVTMSGAGHLSSAGGTFTIAPGMTVRGSSGAASIYGIGSPDRPTVNEGHVIADGLLMISGSTLINTGTFESKAGGVLAFGGGPFTRADLGTLVQSGGAFRIAGLLDNTGQTFVVDNSTGDWQLGGGTIKGGTLEIAAGKSLFLPGSTHSVLDDVAVNGTVQFDPTSLSEISVRIPAGQTLRGNAEFVFSGSSFTSSITGSDGLAIAPGVVIRGAGGTVGDASGPLVNRGHIKAQDASRSIDVVGNTLTNFGTLESAGGQLNLRGSYTRAALGHIVNGTSVAIAGTLDNTGQTTTLDDGAGTWRMQRGGRIVGGTVNIPPGEALVVTPAGGLTAPNEPATLDGVTFNGRLRVEGPLRILNGLSGANEIVGADSGSLVAPGTLTIAPGTTVRFPASTGTFAVGDGTQAIINQGEIVAEGLRIHIQGSSVSNAGIVGLASPGGSIWITTPLFSNAGSLMIPGGTITLFGDGTFDSGGRLEIGRSALTGIAGRLEILGDLDLSSQDDYFELLAPLNEWPLPQTIITYTGSLTGVFNHVPAGVVLDYAVPNQVRVAAVPEPSAAALAAISAAALRRRRRH